MGIFDKFKNTKSLPEKPQTEELSKNIYVELGIIEPFTLLVGKQFNSFVAELAKNKSGILNDIEKKAFDVLWDVACIDIDGFGNNIWNLKVGSFEIYNKEEVILRFEKKTSKVKEKYGFDEGRANFAYLSKDGNFIISQSDRNKKAFLVYVSENMTDRLLKALRNAEAEALEIKKDNSMSNTRIGIPDTISIPSISGETSRNINTQYRINAAQSDNIELSDYSVKRR